MYEAIYDLILGFKKNLLKSSHPSVINIASIYGSIVPDFSIYNETKISNPPEYSCSKAALIYLTKWISKNFINKIRVNSISPGGIYRKQEKIFIEKYKKKTKFNRMTYEKDILNSIIFLASAKSGYVTGQNIIVDGGFSN
jgi:NAD(P)-dependent dehydrogenase (short-subunit alcohol dehydrogenase family)